MFVIAQHIKNQSEKRDSVAGRRQDQSIEVGMHPCKKKKIDVFEDGL